MRIKTALAAAALAVAALAAACGGSDSSSASPSPSPTPTPTPNPTSATTITITSGGTSPRDITVAVGSRVTFVNNDSAPHDMASDPHPAHTDCPDVTVGFMTAGQSRQTNNLTSARTCTYHDHNQPSNTNLQGRIRIQ